MAEEILCVGEVLWDSLPLGLFLGGAPINVAVHLRELGRTVSVATRVGDDVLGREAVRRLKQRGIRTDLVQQDGVLGTGFVAVTLDDHGDPTYEIVQPVAWDDIECTEALRDRASASRALVFGSLAQRSPVSRGTIRALLEAAPYRVFDVNLRPPFDDREIVEASLRRANLVKLNEHEIRRLAEWFDLPPGDRDAVYALCDRFGCETVCVTRGDRGALLFHEESFVEHGGYSVQVQDAVGAGDAFLAALLDGLLAGSEPEAVLLTANAIGAYAATRMGAMPSYDWDEINRLEASG